MSTIKVDKITGRTGSAGASSPLQFNGDTLSSAKADIIKLTPGSAPGSPTAGEIYFNSTLKAMCFWDGAMWRIISGGPSGGEIHDYLLGGVSYRSHTFVDVGDSGFYLPATTTLDVLMVGGGGAGGMGGGTYGAGGGAGGMIVRPARSTTAGTYAITIGQGGTGAGGVSKNVSTYNFDGAGTNGYNTTAFGMTALGGGYGGFGPTSGVAGGSGGGSGNQTSTGTGAGTQTTDGSISAESKTYGFGNAGADTLASGTGTTGKAGSGGGAGSVGNFYRGEEFTPASGQEHYDRGMVGGDGKVNDYRTGVDIFYACGAGSAGWGIGDKTTLGGTYTIESGIGGYGAVYPSGCGSCLDARSITDIRKRAGAQSGTPHTGNGGGGGCNHYYDTDGGNSYSGDGGSGIIVIRYVV